MPTRRFTPPWDIEDNGSCFIIRDNNWQALSYVYYESEPGRRTAAAGLLTRDEARRIAINIAKLPELLKRAAVLPGNRTGRMVCVGKNSKLLKSRSLATAKLGSRSDVHEPTSADRSTDTVAGICCINDGA